MPASPSIWQRLTGENGLQKWGFYVPLIFMVLFFALPVALTLVWSFFERTTFWMEPGFTLFAYESFFTSARAENYLFSMMHSGISVIIAFSLGFPIAVFVRRRVPQVAQHRVILLFILPFMISELVRVFAMRPILGRFGIINNLLMDMRVISEPITSILFSPTAVVIGEVVSFLPFMVFSGFLAMEAVEQYIFDVCDDLGVGRVRTFKDVIVPLAAPGISIVPTIGPLATTPVAGNLVSPAAPMAPLVTNNMGFGPATPGNPGRDGFDPIGLRPGGGINAGPGGGGEM